MDTETTLPTAAPVVDFARYRAERAQRQLDFDRVPEPARLNMGSVGARALTPRDISHRARMLQFLAGQPEGQRSKVQGHR